MAPSPPWFSALSMAEVEVQLQRGSRSSSRPSSARRSFTSEPPIKQPLAEPRASKASAVELGNAPDLWPLWLAVEHHAPDVQSMPLINSMMGSEWKRDSMDVWVTRGTLASLRRPRGEEQATTLRQRCQSRYMIPVGSWKNLLWQLPGGILIMYDVVMVPMQCFDFNHGVFFAVMAWLAAWYWTLDMVLTFFVCYEIDGYPVSDPWRVAWNYAKTWLLLDVAVLSMDWIFVALGQDGMGSRSWRIAKVLRPLRVIRSLKAARCFQAVVDNLHSQVLVIALKLCMVLVAVVLAVHYAACTWCGLGLRSLVALDTQSLPTTWVEEKGYAAADLALVYGQGMLWAFAMSGMSTPVGLEPTNWLEELFSMLVTGSWVVVLAFVFSQFTIYSIQVRELYLDCERREAQIRRYLGEYNISAELGNCIMRFFRFNSSKLRSPMSLLDSHLFTELPLPMRIELHRQAHMPVLKAHPAIMLVDAAALTSLCHLALRGAFYGSGHMLFSKGECASMAFYAQSTGLTYHIGHSTSWDNIQGRFIAEAALWKRWTHAGWLVARSSSKLIEIVVERFLEVLQESEHAGFAIAMLREYAVAVTAHFDGVEPQSDLWDGAEVISLAAGDEVESATPAASAPWFRRASFIHVVNNMSNFGRPATAPNASACRPMSRQR